MAAARSFVPRGRGDRHGGTVRAVSYPAARRSMMRAAVGSGAAARGPWLRAPCRHRSNRGHPHGCPFGPAPGLLGQEHQFRSTFHVCHAAWPRISVNSQGKVLASLPGGAQHGGTGFVLSPRGSARRLKQRWQMTLQGAQVRLGGSLGWCGRTRLPDFAAGRVLATLKCSVVDAMQTEGATVLVCDRR